MTTRPPQQKARKRKVHRHRLSNDTRKELTAFLQLDSTKDRKQIAEVMEQVEAWLGYYWPTLEEFESLPRPSQFVGAMHTLEIHTSTLKGSLENMHPRIRDAVNRSGIDLKSLEDELSRLQESAGEIGRSKSAEQSKGRPKSEVLQKVVGELRRLFRQYYKGAMTSQKVEGAVTNLSEAEQDEAEFIGFALDDAKIAHPKKIRRILDKPGTPLADRKKAIDKIYSAAERRIQNSPPPEDAPEK